MERLGADFGALSVYLLAKHRAQKIKHPIFLATKFHECISLYVNGLKLPGLSQQDAALRLMCKLHEVFVIESQQLARSGGQQLGQIGDSELAEAAFAA